MVSVSPAFTAAANADTNYPRAKCDILFTDSSVQTENTVTTNSMNNCSGLSSTVTDAMLLQVIDAKDITPKKFIVNDGTWINDGTWYPCPGSLEELSSNQFGWYTAEISDGSGNFATPPELRIDFGNPRAINQLRVFGLSVAGLPAYDQYPTDFDIKIYDGNDNLLNTTTNFIGTSVERIIDFSEDEIIDATYMILRLNSWSESNTVGKITEFYGVISTTVYGDDIVSMDILEELEDDGQISINDMNLELQNVDILDQIGQKLLDPYLPDNTDSYLKNAITSNVRLNPYLGFKLPATFNLVESIIKTTDATVISASSGIVKYGVFYGELVKNPSVQIVDQVGVTVSIVNSVLHDWYCIVSVVVTSGTSGTYKLQISGYAVNTPSSIEYVPMGAFWSTDWNTSEWNFSASITARDRMEFLRLNKFTLDNVLINKTLYEIAETVLNHAKVNIPLNDLVWSIDSLLSQITIPYAWFGKNVTYFEALRKISQACIGRSYMNRNDVLVIESFLADESGGVPDVEITANDYLKCDRPVKNSSVKYRVVVPVSEFVLSEQGDIATSDDFSILTDTLDVVVEWGDDAVLEAEVIPEEETGVTVSFTNVKYYAWGITLTANKLTGTLGAFKVKVTGKKLELNVIREVEAVNSLYSEKDADRKTERLPQNFLVQTNELGQYIADNELRAASDPTNECVVENFGNPAIEIGDIANIEVYSKLSVIKEFRIFKQQHKYDGGLRATITGKKPVQFGD